MRRYFEWCYFLGASPQTPRVGFAEIGSANRPRSETMLLFLGIEETTRSIYFIEVRFQTPVDRPLDVWPWMEESSAKQNNTISGKRSFSFLNSLMFVSEPFYFSNEALFRVVLYPGG
jgi:hypothetical protein